MSILLLLLGLFASKDDISLSAATAMIGIVGLEHGRLGNDIIVNLRSLDGGNLGRTDIRSPSALYIRQYRGTVVEASVTYAGRVGATRSSGILLATDLAVNVLGVVGADVALAWREMASACSFQGELGMVKLQCLWNWWRDA